MADNQFSLIQIGSQTDGYSIRLTPRVMPQDGLLARLDISSKTSSVPFSNTITAKFRDGGTIVVPLANSVSRNDEIHDVLMIMTLNQVKN